MASTLVHSKGPISIHFPSFIRWPTIRPIHWMYALVRSSPLDPAFCCSFSAPLVLPDPPVTRSVSFPAAFPLHLLHSKSALRPRFRFLNLGLQLRLLDLAFSSFFGRWLTRRSAHSRPPHLRALFSPHLEPCPASTSPWIATSALRCVQHKLTVSIFGGRQDGNSDLPRDFRRFSPNRVRIRGKRVRAPDTGKEQNRGGKGRNKHKDSKTEV